MLVLTDLGSANGVLVNGVSVVEVALGVGDRIQIGDTVLVVDTLAPG
jgi:pSer/pThr/pTyr-binding forkhead associated (FHA) protein